VDKRDIQLLEIMAQNCRISHTTIARALHISKDTVTYKLKQLECNALLTQYVLFIDARRFGFTRYHILIKFDSGVKQRERIYKKIAEHPFVMWINSFIGKYDLQIIVDATDSFHLNAIREKIFEICGHRIDAVAECSLTFLTSSRR